MVDILQSLTESCYPVANVILTGIVITVLFRIYFFIENPEKTIMVLIKKINSIVLIFIVIIMSMYEIFHAVSLLKDIIKLIIIEPVAELMQ